MASTFYGVPCTPDGLNTWLQDNKGYDRVDVAKLTSVGGDGSAGDTVHFAFRHPGARRGNSFLIEGQKRYAPIAAVSIVADSGATGTGIITARFGTTPPSGGQHGWVYNAAIGSEASAGYTNGTWKIVPLGSTAATPVQAESLLALNMPIMIHTRVDGARRPHHWVLAEGREPAFRSATTAQGTYRVVDPYFREDGVPVVRLIQPPHYNLYTEARVCSLVATAPIQGAPTVVRRSDTETGKLRLTLQGPARMVVETPTGQVVSYDAGTDSYTSGIPGVELERAMSIEDASDTTDSEPVVIDRIGFPVASDGTYRVTIQGEGTGSYVLQASTPDAAIGPDCVVVEGDIGSLSSEVKYITYSYASGVGVMTPVSGATTNVSPALSLAVSPNPANRSVRIAFSIPQPGAARVEIFDVAGRQVRTIVDGTFPAGLRTLSRDGSDSDGRLAHAGVYLLRLSAGRSTIVRRVVVLP